MGCMRLAVPFDICRYGYHAGAYRNRGQRGQEGARGGHGPPVLMGVSVYRYVHNGPHADASVLLTSLRYS